MSLTSQINVEIYYSAPFYVPFHSHIKSHPSVISSYLGVLAVEKP